MKYLLSLLYALTLTIPLAADVDAMAVTWEYNENLQLASMREFSNTPQQRKTQYVYDDFGHLSEIIKPDGVVLYHHFDTKSRLIGLQSSDGSVHYEYFYNDNDDITQINDLTNDTITSHVYDSSGQLLSHTQANGHKIQYETLDQEQTFIVTLPDDSTINYQYNEPRLKTIIRKSATGDILYTHHYARDTQGDLLYEIMAGEAGKLTTTMQDHYIQSISSPVWKEIIPRDGFNAQKNVEHLNIHDPLGEIEACYTYDDKQQLTSETYSNATTTYNYDFLNNRIQKNEAPYDVDSLNQTLSTESTHYTYDLNGNVSSITTEEGTAVFLYDALDRLTEVVKNQSFRVLHTYDAYHRRQTKSHYLWNHETSSWGRHEFQAFLYTGNDEIGSTDADGNMKELRILGEGLIADIGTTKLIELPSGNYATVCDHRGNICCLIDIETGTPKEYYRYTAFGEEQIYNENDELISAQSALNPWRFSNKRTDPETKLVFFGKRYYCPEIGKWITPDPIGFRDGPNRYLYVNNNPINRIDPYGFFSISTYTEKIKSTIISCFQLFKEYIHDHNSPEAFDQSLGDFTRFLVGNGLFSLSNYNSSPQNTSVYQGNNSNPKRRITFINGILNDQEQIDQMVKAISEWEDHNDEDVYYVFRGTEGWTRDIIKSLLIRFGLVSDNAQELANVWKQLIKDMGGPDSGGEIIHWAHSIGGTETLRARDLLTPEEQKMIKIITFGSATIVPNEGFGSVINHLSYRDGVSCISDPISFLYALITKPDHVDFKGSLLGLPFDHFFDAYLKYLEKIMQDK